MCTKQLVRCIISSKFEPPLFPPSLSKEPSQVAEFGPISIYHQISDISCTLGNRIADYSDVVGAVPVGAAPTTSSFST